MFSLMLLRIILVLTLITRAVNSGPNIYWSKRSGDHRPGEYQGNKVFAGDENKPNQSLQREGNKTFAKQYREFPLFPFSTIVRSKMFRRNEVTENNPNLRRYLDNKIYPFLHL